MFQNLNSNAYAISATLVIIFGFFVIKQLWKIVTSPEPARNIDPEISKTARVSQDAIPILSVPNLAELTPPDEFKRQLQRFI